MIFIFLDLSFLFLVLCTRDVTSNTSCPDTWVAYRGSCYLFNPDRASNYADAMQFCSLHNGHLVVIEDIHENNFLKDFLKRLKPMGWWIGLTDELVEGEWIWYHTKQSPEFEDWQPGEPDSNGGKLDEDCASMYLYTNYHWVDVECTQIYAPICESEANSDVGTDGIIG